MAEKKTYGPPVAPAQGGQSAAAGFQAQPTKPTPFGVAGSELQGSDIENIVNRSWMDILQGKSGRYSPERVAAEKQELWSTEKGRERQLLERMNRDAIARGVARGGLAHRDTRTIALETASRISAGERQIKMAQIQAEFEDKMAALNMAQKSLDSRRQYELGKEQIAAQREATRAHTALGYAQIAAQKEIARRQAGIAASRLGFDREQFEWSKEKYEESKIPIPAELSSNFGGQTSLTPAVFDRIFGSSM